MGGSASWNSPSGRKGELIQTHYFMSKFGVRIQASGDVPQVDFYLAPTIQELTDLTNPLSLFPAFSKLAKIANLVQSKLCETVAVDDLTLSKFNNPVKGRFNTQATLGILESALIPHTHRQLAIECFNSFDKGPQRTIIFLLMLDDLRQGRLKPALLTSEQCGSIYDGLSGTYQSPKAIQIYAQQSFGNVHAMPIDTWIETFFKWPLVVWPTKRTKQKYHSIFSGSRNLGKTERLLWVAAQARKVHSSACNDILWCTKYSSEKKPRGANPLACNICLENIRNCCPAYNEIKDKSISLNDTEKDGADFYIVTTQNKSSQTQSFVACAGYSIYDGIYDDFSPADNPSGFAPFIPVKYDKKLITVQQFIDLY